MELNSVEDIYQYIIKNWNQELFDRFTKCILDGAKEEKNSKNYFPFEINHIDNYIIGCIDGVYDGYKKGYDDGMRDGNEKGWEEGYSSGVCSRFNKDLNVN